VHAGKNKKFLFEANILQDVEKSLNLKNNRKSRKIRSKAYYYGKTKYQGLNIIRSGYSKHFTIRWFLHKWFSYLKT
jgi:hypothetical protein